MELESGKHLPSQTGTNRGQRDDAIEMPLQIRITESAGKQSSGSSVQDAKTVNLHKIEFRILTASEAAGFKRKKKIINEGYDLLNPKLPSANQNTTLDRPDSIKSPNPSTEIKSPQMLFDTYLEPFSNGSEISNRKTLSLNSHRGFFVQDPMQQRGKFDSKGNVIPHQIPTIEAIRSRIKHHIFVKRDR
ncbi:hypothetical protein Tco_0976070 [Tanacetum coccineum]|uniref:Uncharacterized protein n=1 Tax=Tanacetum coccineum TaxID=301880 RepID=A0ABQ5EGI8_9ASTR